MVTPRFKLEVDWNNDGEFRDTGETINMGRVRAGSYTHGRDRASQLLGRSIAGRARFVLENTSGDYSSFNSSSPLTGNLLPNRLVRLMLEGRAAFFTTANSESLTGGDVLDITTPDFSIAFWIYPTTLAQVGIVNKRDRASSTNLGYAIELQSDGTLDALISDGTSVTTSSSTTTLSAGAWAFCVFTADRDGSAQWYINDGAAEGATAISTQNGTLANAIRFGLGEGFSGSADRFYGGRMVAVGLWTKLLSTAERTFLYNDGSGRRYAYIGLTGDGSTLKTSLQAWYDLNEASGTRTDSENSNNLTDNNTVVDAVGIANYPQWQGFVHRITPKIILGGDSIAILEAIGPLGQINQDEVSIAMQTSQRTDQIIGTLLDNVGWATNDRTLGVGNTTVTRYAADRQTPIAAMREMEAAENGFIKETKDGRIAFENRHFRLAGDALTSQATFSDAAAAALPYSELSQEDPLPFIFNQFEVEVTIYTVASIATLWTLPETGANSPSIEVGETRTYWARYPNPASANDAWAVDAWTTPAATTDYTANSESGGGGTNLTSDVGISVGKFANAMKIDLTNNHATLKMFITALRARGTAVTVDDPVMISELDSTSQTAFGERIWPDRPKYIPDSAEAYDWTQFQLSIYKDPNVALHMAYWAERNQAALDELLRRDVGDRITLVAQNNANLGINREVFIEAVTVSFGPNIATKVRYLLSDAEQFSDWWVWGTSTWGETTRWAY